MYILSPASQPGVAPQLKEYLASSEVDLRYRELTDIASPFFLTVVVL